MALIVAQSRDRKNQLSGILLTSLSQALMRVSSAAKKLKGDIMPNLVHLLFKSVAF